MRKEQQEISPKYLTLEGPNSEGRQYIESHFARGASPKQLHMPSSPAGTLRQRRPHRQHQNQYDVYHHRREEDGNEDIIPRRPVTYYFPIRPPQYRSPERRAEKTKSNQVSLEDQHSNLMRQKGHLQDKYIITTTSQPMSTTVRAPDFSSTEDELRQNLSPSSFVKDSDNASLGQLGPLSSLGVRKSIPGHNQRQSSSNKRVYYKPEQNKERSSYHFTAGEVHIPQPFNRPPAKRLPYAPRITTLRPSTENAGILSFQDENSLNVPRYIKEPIAEMDFEPKTVETAFHPSLSKYANWFLMPVQAWFALSIILAALMLVLLIVLCIIYRGYKIQKRKVIKLTYMVSTCVDPTHHELCSCRAITPFARSQQAIMARASMMSRASHRSTRTSYNNNNTLPYKGSQLEDAPPPLSPKAGTAILQRAADQKEPKSPGDMQLTTIFPPPRRFEL